MRMIRNLSLLMLLCSTVGRPLSAQPDESLSLQPPVYLPDGSEFKSWECTTEFTKTYWVDQHDPAASDSNPGTTEAPFLTIDRAARIVRAGERVVIKSGVYREQVTPKFGGEGPEEMISYEAAPGARVVIKGSRIVGTPWKPSRNPSQFSEKLWMTALASALFTRENPFSLENASTEDIEIMPWATEWSDRVPYTLKRGLLFQDGRRMTQLAVYEDLVRLPGSYWVAPDNLTLHVHPFEERNPNDVTMEVTVHQHLFKPKVTDLGYIRIKGLTFLHAGNGFPRTGVGAIFTMGGHHWIIEDNSISEVGSVGIEIGTRSLESANRELSRADQARARRSPGHVIVRNNDLSQCGTGGIQGLEVRRALIENNRVTDSGWQDVERYWETAAIKLLINESTLVRRNTIAHFVAGSAIWLDWNNRNSRITQNLVYDLWMCCNGALFIEASQVPNMIDNNIVFNIRGTGVYTGDTDNLIIAHNLIGACTGPGVQTRVATERSVNGRRVTSTNNQVLHNIFYDTAEPVRFESSGNVSDANVFAYSSGRFDLAVWQRSGQDEHSVRVDMQLEFAPGMLELKWNAPPLPTFDAVEYIDTDYHGSHRPSNAVTPGPFQDRFAGPVILDVTPIGREAFH